MTTKIEKTDWNRYYQSPFKTAGLTKPFIIKKVFNYLKKYAPQGQPLSITEFGGGNSCFYEIFQNRCAPQTYYIVDNNELGLQAFRERFGEQQNTRLCNADILDFHGDWMSDVVFSVGLIEHFSQSGTQLALQAHLHVLKPGGILILGFPTPTWLYRFSRAIIESLGLWMFPDERALKIEEVVQIIKKSGQVLETAILWPIVLTQAFVVLQKN